MRITIDVSDIDEFATHMDKTPTWIQDEVREAFKILLNLMRADAMRICPYKTGFLRSTIFAKERGWTFRLGAWAYYARFQEYGTRYIHARRFIGRAIEWRWPMARDLIRRALVLAIEKER